MISVVPLSSRAFKIGSRFRASSGAEMTFSTPPSYPRVRSLSSGLAALAILASAACQQAPTSRSPTPSPTLAATPFRACPLGSPPANPQLLVSGQAAPDDLAFDDQGRL